MSNYNDTLYSQHAMIQPFVVEVLVWCFLGSCTSIGCLICFVQYLLRTKRNALVIYQEQEKPVQVASDTETPRSETA